MIDLPPPFVCPAPRVIDGDTIDCPSGRVRLARIDAPELAGHCRRGRHCAPGDGPASKAALSRLVGRSLRCVPVPYRDGARTAYDRYGRMVAHCYAGPVDVGEAMVRGGWAVRWPHR